jgi:RNA polymerase sigma factor (sigma-70 family)
MKSPLTRQTLLEKLKDRYDESSWEEFRQTYGPYILRVLRAMRMNSHDCEDLQQNIMLISWKSLPNFDYQPDKGSFRAWISTVTRREAIHYIKKRQKNFISVNEDETERLLHVLDTISKPDIEQSITTEWQQFISEKAWGNIKTRFSEKVLQAFEMITKGIEVEEIAKGLSISDSSVYVYKKRVLNTLQKEILKLDRELG